MRRREIMAMMAGAVPFFLAGGSASAQKVGPICAPGSEAAESAPQAGLGFLELCARNRADGSGHLVTESTLLHFLGLSVTKAQRDFERAELIPAFNQWVSAIAAHAKADPGAKSTLAARFAGFVAGLASSESFLDGPEAAEARLINAAEGPALSPILGVMIDYSGMKPRGHYATDPDLRRFFVASRYASAAPFFVRASGATLVSEEGARNLFAAAHQMSRWMNKGTAADLTRSLFGRLETAFGRSEDFSALDLVGDVRAAETIRADWAMSARDRRRVPSVLDVVMDVKALKGEDARAIAISWRFLPGRRQGESAAFQALTFPNTGAALDPAMKAFGLGDIGGQKVKAYAGLDDYFALLGVDTGRASRESGFADWDTAFARAKLELLGEGGRDASAFTHFASTVLKTPRPGRLEAVAGHFVHYRHSRALYDKQSTTSTPKGLRLKVEQGPPLLVTDAAFVEALGDLAKARSVQFPAAGWDLWMRLLADLPAILNAQSSGCLTGRAADRVNSLDQALAPAFDAADDRPIVVDIHSAGGEKKVVEIGLGWPKLLSHSGARGGQFRIFQFKQPQAKRLTDAEFADMLAQGGAEDLVWLPQEKA